MCGIAGVVGDPNVDRASAAVAAINRRQARRGPDAEGLDAFPPAVLGHRRLSIYDLSAAGKQPMTSADGLAAISFNGSVYNFPEIRRDLEAAGVRFRTQTDTEVLLEGYRAWGLDRLLDRCRGMWAFGLWDLELRKLFLVRDRLGVKPLCYAVRDGALAFASSAAALDAAGFAGELDPEALADYFDYGFVTDARSIYQGVRKVRAGGIVEWSEAADGQWKQAERCYWQAPVEPTAGAISFEEAVEETERLLEQAIRRRAFADVPLAALLSGGVDSALICSGIAKAGFDIKAYTIAVPGDRGDESEDARLTAQEIGLPLEVLDATSEDFPDVDELTAAYGEPFACSSALGMLRLARLIQPNATALLTGDGGDDVFLGYPEHRLYFNAQRIAGSTPGPAAALWRGVRGAIPRVGPVKRARSFMDYSMGGLGAAQRVRDGIGLLVDEGLLGERMLDAARNRPYLEPSIESARRLLPDFLGYDHGVRFTGEYLTKVDGGSMHYALEARSPFLDQDLWEFAASLPFAIRLRGGVLKAVLRELVRRQVSERVATGRKRGFTVPASRWLVSRWRQQAEERFGDSALARDGWIDSAKVRAVLDRSVAAGAAPNRLWYLYVLESWYAQRKGG